MKFIFKPSLTIFLIFSAWPLLAQTSDGAHSIDWDSAPTVDLRNVGEQAETLPFLLEPVVGIRSMVFHRGLAQGGLSCLVTDLDGDGQVEALKGRPSSFDLSELSSDGPPLTLDQFNFPLEYHSPDPDKACCTLQGPFDLDGDGKLEVVASAVTADGFTWGFWVVSVPDLQLLSHFTMNSFPQRKADAKWDGTYFVMGSVSGLLSDPRREALILGLSVGFDINGRGVLAVDPATGETLWHFEAGSKIGQTRQAQVVDLDDDGQKEIVIIGSGVGNLKEGELLGPYGDRETRLIVLNRKGQELWSRQLEEGMSTGLMAIGDLDEHPGQEICATSMVNQTAQSKLTTWNATGQKLVEVSLPARGMDIRISGRSDAPTQDILLTTNPGHLFRIRWGNGRLQVINQASFSSYPQHQSVPAPNAGGFEPFPVYERATNTTILLGEDLRPLACLPVSGPWKGHMYLPFSTPVGQFLHYVGPDNTLGLQVVKNPNALPANPALRMLAVMPRWGWAVLVLTLLTIVSWWQLARKHRQLSAGQPAYSTQGDHKREAQLHLLEDLEISGHGAMAPLRTFRRLMWLLDAVKTGVEFKDSIAMRFREIWADCYKDDIPRLLIVLDRARQAQLEYGSIDTAAHALLHIQSQLGAIKEDDFDLERIKASGTSLHEQGEIAEDALQNLREEVSQIFQADLAEAVKKVLRAHEESLAAANIKVHMGQTMAAAQGGGLDSPAPEADLLCRIDHHELGFIIDNLVSNATRAMDGFQDCRLGLTWLATNGLIKLEVSDTGIGIAEEDLDHIMDTPFTTKKGGGLGLHHSQRILRKYGGQLSIIKSSPGKGTTFQLLLPKVRKESRVRLE